MFKDDDQNPFERKGLFLSMIGTLMLSTVFEPPRLRMHRRFEHHTQISSKFYYESEDDAQNLSECIGV